MPRLKLQIKRSIFSAFSTQLAVIFVVISILCVYRIISFESWAQVADLYSYHISFTALFGHPHFFRFLIAYPGLFLSDKLGDQMFSIYIVGFMIGGMYVVCIVLERVEIKYVYLNWVGIFIVHMFMNGRGAISWFGWMIVIFIMFKTSESKESLMRTAIILIALLCCSVSSGTFSVAFCSVVIFYFYKAIITRNAYTIFVLVLTILTYKDLFFIGIERNVQYFTIGSSNIIFNMSQHGVGYYLIDNAGAISLTLSLIMIPMTYLVFYLKNKPKFVEVLAIVMPIAGGAFGYTTLTLVLPSLFLTIFARARGGDISRDAVAR
jgi:hypothetical protein